MVLIVLIGFFGVYIFVNYDFFGKRLIKVVLIVFFVMLGIMVVFGFVIFFGKGGIIVGLIGCDLGIIYFWKVIFLVYFFYNFLIVVRMVLVFW